MVEAGHDACLGEIVVRILPSLEPSFGWNLNRNLPQQLFVKAQIDSSKAAFTQNSIQAIATFLMPADRVAGDICDGRHLPVWGFD